MQLCDGAAHKWLLPRFAENYVRALGVAFPTMSFRIKYHLSRVPYDKAVESQFMRRSIKTFAGRADIKRYVVAGYRNVFDEIDINKPAILFFESGDYAVGSYVGTHLEPRMSGDMLLYE